MMYTSLMNSICYFRFSRTNLSF